jgi:thiosulfate dehydrogenase
MARTKSTSSRSRGKKGSGGKVFLGVLLGIVLTLGAVYGLYRYTSVLTPLLHRPRPAASSLPPTAPVTQPSAPTRKLTQKMATVARDAPFSPSEDVFEGGAHTYVARCASCHGNTRLTADTGLEMNPPAGQFFYGKRPHPLSVTRSAQVYEIIANGLPHQGMPGYKDQLTDTQIWQLSLLLESSSLELPDPVRRILSTSTNK